MTRYVAITAFTLIAAAVIGFVFHGRERWIALAIVWTAYAIVFGLGIGWVKFQFFAPTICHGPTDQPRVAITFDDGPDGASTPALLDLLAREHIPAAFFCIGQRVEANPDLARRIVSDRHLIGNHTQSHQWWTCLMVRPLLWREIKRCQDTIARVTGIMPRYMRPPVGLTNPHFNSGMKRYGLKLVGWSMRPRDTIRPPAAVIDHVVRHTKNGSIILLHDGGVKAGKLVETASGVIEQLRTRGFVFERLDRLIEPEPVLAVE